MLYNDLKKNVQYQYFRDFHPLNTRANMKANSKLMSKCKNIVNKYHKKKSSEGNLNLSFELPENHFFNKRVHDGKVNSTLMKSKKRKEKISFTKLKPEKTEYKSQIENHIYETLSSRRCNKTLKSMPSNLKIMPLIPFWRSSFEIIDNQYPCADKTVMTNTLRNVPEALYVTMQGYRASNEPIYV